MAGTLLDFTVSSVASTATELMRDAHRQMKRCRVEAVGDMDRDIAELTAGGVRVVVQIKPSLYILAFKPLRDIERPVIAVDRSKLGVPNDGFVQVTFPYINWTPVHECALDTAQRIAAEVAGLVQKEAAEMSVTILDYQMSNNMLDKTPLSFMISFRLKSSHEIAAEKQQTVQEPVDDQLETVHEREAGINEAGKEPKADDPKDCKEANKETDANPTQGTQEPPPRNVSH